MIRPNEKKLIKIPEKENKLKELEEFLKNWELFIKVEKLIS